VKSLLQKYVEVDAKTKRIICDESEVRNFYQVDLFVSDLNVYNHMFG
jgi:hypothetical protein